MPKSGKADQWCPCGSNLRPHVAISFAARSLHVAPRVKAQETTIYCCPRCVIGFEKTIDQQAPWARAMNPIMRDRFLSAIAASCVAVWDEIERLLPK